VILSHEINFSKLSFRALERFLNKKRILEKQIVLKQNRHQGLHKHDVRLLEEKFLVE